MKKLSESQSWALQHLSHRTVEVHRVEQRWVGLPDGIRTMRTLEQLAQAGLCRRSFDHVQQCIVFTITPLGLRTLRLNGDATGPFASESGI